MTLLQKDEREKFFSGISTELFQKIILAIFLALSSPMVSHSGDRGRDAATMAQLGNIKCALVNYRSNIGHYPAVGIAIAPSKIVGIERNCLFHKIDFNGSENPLSWDGPYMEDDPKEFMIDAYNNRIYYYTIGINGENGALLLSAGKNGIFETIDGINKTNLENGNLDTWPEKKNDDLWAIVFRKPGT